MAYTYKYPRPAVTADCIVITREAEPKVLLIQRGNPPFKGAWASARESTFQGSMGIPRRFHGHG